MAGRRGKILGDGIMDKRKMRRKNLLYKLRRKGIRCDTKGRCIEYPYGGEPRDVPQIRRLMDEYKFNIQFVIV